jgi:hypothetical protein
MVSVHIPAQFAGLLWSSVAAWHEDSHVMHNHIPRFNADSLPIQKLAKAVWKPISDHIGQEQADRCHHNVDS